MTALKPVTHVSPSEALKKAGEPIIGCYSDRFDAGLRLMRLLCLGWQFKVTDSAIEINKGGSWHVIDSLGCNCRSYAIRKWCYPSRAVVLIGVDNLKYWIPRVT